MGRRKRRAPSREAKRLIIEVGRLSDLRCAALSECITLRKPHRFDLVYLAAAEAHRLAKEELNRLLYLEAQRQPHRAGITHFNPEPTPE